MNVPITRINCTVDDCDWFYDEPGPPSGLDQWPTVPARDINDYINQVMRQRRQAAEAVLAEHLATHEPIDYLRTIQRLNRRVAALEAQLPAPERSHEELLRGAQELAREMDAELGPVTEGELEGLRAVWPPTSPPSPDRR